MADPPTPATLDAAVEAAARALFEDARSAAPDVPVTYEQLPAYVQHHYAHTARTVLHAAGHADQLAQAHAAGTAEGAKAERERIAAHLLKLAEFVREGGQVDPAHTFCCEPCPALALEHAAAIARAGTSGDAT